MVMAQANCFSALNAGDNASYCEGETATLDGGYDFYDEPGDPDTGTPTLTWTITDGDGEFFVDGVKQGDGSTATGTNFNNSENGITGEETVTFAPADGVFEVTLRLVATTTGDNGRCAGPQVEDVTLYFDPFQETPIDASLNGTLVFNDGDDQTTNVIDANTGDNLSMVIDESNVIDNSTQNDDIQRYEVVYSGPGGFIGLPPAGIYTKNQFDVLFFDNELTSISCDPASLTMTVYMFYDRDNDMEFDGAGECPGPVTEVTINVAPRPVVQATIGAVEDILIVCEDDETVEVVVTGTANTLVTYTVSYDGGATVPDGPQTLELDANQISFDIVLDANDGTPGEDIVVTLIGQEYLTGPACPQVISKPLTIEVLPLPTLDISLTDPADAVGL